MTLGWGVVSDIEPLPRGRVEWDDPVVTDRDKFITWVQSVLRDAEIAVHNGDCCLGSKGFTASNPGQLLAAVVTARPEVAQRAAAADAACRKSFYSRGMSTLATTLRSWASVHEREIAATRADWAEIVQRSES